MDAKQAGKILGAAALVSVPVVGGFYAYGRVKEAKGSTGAASLVGGLVAIVVIEPIRELVASTLARAEVEVTLRRDTADYSVFHYRRSDSPPPGAAPPPAPAGFAAGTYDRGPLVFEDLRGLPVRLDAVEGLAGFDRVDPARIGDVRFTNIGEMSSPPIAEWVMACMLMFAKGWPGCCRSRSSLADQ